MQVFSSVCDAWIFLPRETRTLVITHHFTALYIIVHSPDWTVNLHGLQGGGRWCNLKILEIIKDSGFLRHNLCLSGQEVRACDKPGPFLTSRLIIFLTHYVCLYKYFFHLRLCIDKKNTKTFITLFVSFYWRVLTHRWW